MAVGGVGVGGGRAAGRAVSGAGGAGVVSRLRAVRGERVRVVPGLAVAAGGGAVEGFGGGGGLRGAFCRSVCQSRGGMSWRRWRLWGCWAGVRRRGWRKGRCF